MVKNDGIDATMPSAIQIQRYMFFHHNEHIKLASHISNFFDVIPITMATTVGVEFNFSKVNSVRLYFAQIKSATSHAA